MYSEPWELFINTMRGINKDIQLLTNPNGSYSLLPDQVAVVLIADGIEKIPPEFLVKAAADKLFNKDKIANFINHRNFPKEDGSVVQRIMPKKPHELGLEPDEESGAQ